MVDIDPSIPIIKFKWNKYFNKRVKLSDSILRNSMVIRSKFYDTERLNLKEWEALSELLGDVW